MAVKLPLGSKPVQAKMARVFEKQTFGRFYDDGGRVFEDLEFRRCRFESSSISITHDPKLRSTVRNVKVINCEEQGCTVNSAIVEDVLIDGFKTHGLFRTHGAVFKHVVLRGKIGRIMLSHVLPSILLPDEQRKEIERTFQHANADYYATVDWALDISEAQAEEIAIRAIPAHLIRRDPATQVVITREKAMQGKWRQLDLSETWWQVALEHFLKEGNADMVLVAPKRHRQFRQLLDGLKALRDAGVIEPD